MFGCETEKRGFKGLEGWVWHIFDLYGNYDLTAQEISLEYVDGLRDYAICPFLSEAHKSIAIKDIF